ncbi:uncharacterized protein LOC133457684 [Cololabis saira]|uniref:uncharacterized protein LOC133457684 n=1 Tax=Cololabis saira TaxID=129043 RepID=UPI002AD21CEF|nr:uncharacterized protein LOC133457684 [Cololabis saira]XP_061592976.1 uncharacterized protein LOC133457684 [Cololabis saira]
MKSRRFPLRGDHSLLTPDTHPQSGVRPGQEVRSTRVVLVSGHLSDSPICGFAAAPPQRRTSASPTRRLRFEDETETEAETRYLERQQQTRRAGQRPPRALVSKQHHNPHQNFHSTAGLGRREVEPAIRTVGHSEHYGTVMGVNMDLDRGRSPNRPRLNMHTELLRDTYIGCVSPADSCQGRAGPPSPPYMQERRRVVPQPPPTSDLPINPYSSVSSNAPARSSFLHRTAVTSSLQSQCGRTGDSQGGKDLTQKQDRNGTTQHGPGLKDRCPVVKDRCSDTTSKNSSSSGEHKAPPTSGSSDGQVKQPLSVKHLRDNTSNPEDSGSREQPSLLSLHRLFSTVKLSRARSGSLDRLASKPRPPEVDHAPLSRWRSNSLLRK